MGRAFEAAVVGYFVYIFFGGDQEAAGVVEPFFDQPFTGAGLEQLGELLFEDGEAALTDAGKFFQRKVIAKIRFHDIGQGGPEIIAHAIDIREQAGISGVGEDGEHQFAELELQQAVGWWGLQGEVRQEAIKKPLYQAIGA